MAAKAWGELLRADIVGLAGFEAVQRCVAGTPTRAVTPSPATVTAVEEATRTAIALYFRGIKCLHRSVAVTRLLRRHGVQADLMIGCRLPPFQAHAWVEVAGEIVGKEVDGIEYYRVMDRW
jgi:hypothetical protein